jgi:methionyl aminopeptidase
MITIHNDEDFIGMRKAGALAAKILRDIEPHVVHGITTNELDKLCHNMIINHHAIPAPLNYRGFPKSICTSINHVVCHGIPSEQQLNNGDIVNIDVTVIVDGWHGDSSRTFLVGNRVSFQAKKLVEVTYEAMMRAIEVVRPDVPFNEIGRIIEQYVTKHHFSVVRDYCGHGIGKVFHASPNVLHFYDKKCDLIMQKGMFFTIEPMINAGSYETRLLADKWTAVTRDKSLSAQFEHTIGVTNTGYEIFTQLCQDKN